MSIRILSSDLSSQISSGEIIERPASVVKEIIENSIDAGSKNINILIEESGFQSIIVNDDGSGIDKKDLSLAIAHHATSKINVLSDLDTITTFGFRGEALASIRAVSRLTLISRTCTNKLAWKIYSEGFFDNIILEPTAHPDGTTIIIEDLFYNIPVRLKFLKNKRLEFLKILTVIKKIALSHFDIHFSLKHNNKSIAEFHSIKNNQNKIYRLKDVLDKVNLNQWFEIKGKKNNIFLFGWISFNDISKKFKSIQYSYINNRFIQNNIFINAIRAACEETITEKNILFVLYLNIPPDEIDINIHPTKSEIKFNNSNLIYAFIYETVLEFLKKFQKKYCFKNIFYKNRNRIEIKDDVVNTNFNTNTNSISKLLIIIRQYYGLIYRLNNFLLISFPLVQGMIRKKKMMYQFKNKIIPEQFLSYIRINITPEKHLILLSNKNILLNIGFDLILKIKYVILTAVPAFFKKKNINILILSFFNFMFSKQKLSIFEIVNWFYRNIFIELKNWDHLQGIALLSEMEYYCPFLFKNSPPKLLQKININRALCILKI